jgi:antitoxin component YwqK of YwqJK toxin-antitoxin module
MKRKKLLSLFVFIVIFFARSFGQEITNRVDSLGRKQGEWNFFYKKNKIKSKMFYLDNKIHGKIYYYNRKAKITRIQYYNHGVYLFYKTFYIDKNNELGLVKTVHGNKVDYTKSKFYYSDDLSEVNSDTINQIDSNGFRIGIWHERRIYSFFNIPSYDEYYVVGTYKNNKREGNTKFYLFDGHQLQYDANYESGLLNGEFKIYNKKGLCKAKYNYINGVRNGEYVTYFDSGRIRYKGTMKDDKLFGEYFEYDKKGKCILHIKDVIVTPPY